MGFSQLPMLETIVPLYPLTDNVKKYISQPIFSLLVVLRIFSIFPNWMREYFLFCFNILKKIVSEVEHFLKCFLVIFISYTLPIFLFIFPCWLLRIPCIFKVPTPILYVLQKLFLACFWLCACSSNRWNL